MFFYIIIVLLIISVLMAFWSLFKQNKLEGIKEVKKELKRKRVIFYK